MFKKILIANRGEIALRIIRSCKEMGIATVAVYSTADKDSLHVKFADEAVCIGSAKSADSYLNIPNIMAAAEITNADAIHPGYGFLAENAGFAKICEETKIKFIGPTAEMISKMGDKITAKETMIAAGVPCIPGSEDLIKSVESGKKMAEKIGYPVIVKATAGGGGKGMRIIKNPEEFEKQMQSAQQEAAAAFGNDGMYLEKFIVEPRHIEVQIAGDKRGNVCHLSERDCSVQRRHQKLIEECPSPFVDEKLRKKMGDAAIKAAKAIKYEGMGTIEFLVDKYKNFYFMEMNTRIQVEHTITEQVMNYDLIAEQIKIAAGENIVGNRYLPDGIFAMECRINAENPLKNFAPNPGLIKALHIPDGFGVRVDTHIHENYMVPPYYDSMIAKLICTGKSRDEVIRRMRRALKEFRIEGIKTTIPLHLALLENKEFLSGSYDTGIMDRFDYSTIEE